MLFGYSQKCYVLIQNYSLVKGYTFIVYIQTHKLMWQEAMLNCYRI
jgi:hypothetical protein